MWVRAYHPFLYIMHVCRKVNLASSSSWMYIAYNLYCFVLPLIDSLFRTKRGRKICGLYAWLVEFMFYAHMFCFANRRKRFDLVYLHTFAYMFMSIHCIFYCYAWVKGKLLWSFTLIHAYITSWVLSSSKRERLLAQRPIALVWWWLTHIVIVLMILYLYSFRFTIKILVGV